MGKESRKLSIMHFRLARLQMIFLLDFFIVCKEYMVFSSLYFSVFSKFTAIIVWVFIIR